MFSSLLNKVYASVFGYSFSTPSAVDTQEPLTLPKRLHKPVLYALLKDSTDTNQFTKLFDTGSKNENTMDLYTNLFATTHLLRLASTSPTALFNTASILGDRNIVSKQSLTTVSMPLGLSTTVLDYLLFNNVKSATPTYFTELNK